MAYIVPDKMPESCCKCPFGYCKYINPFWSQGKPDRKGYTCSLDKEHRVLDIEIDDETTKAEWCPLREVKTIKTRVTMDGGDSE